MKLSFESFLSLSLFTRWKLCYKYAMINNRAPSVDRLAKIIKIWISAGLMLNFTFNQILEHYVKRLNGKKLGFHVFHLCLIKCFEEEFWLIVFFFVEAIWRTNTVMCHLLTYLWGSQIQRQWMSLCLVPMDQTKCRLSGLLASVLVAMICRVVCYFLTLWPHFNTKVPLDYVYLVVLCPCSFDPNHVKYLLF